MIIYPNFLLSKYVISVQKLVYITKYIAGHDKKADKRGIFLLSCFMLSHFIYPFASI